MDTVIARATEFNEAEHPRGKGDQGGQFVEKGTGSTGGPSPARQRYQPPTSKPGRFHRGQSRSGAPAKPAAPLPVGTLKRGADNDPAAVAQLQAMLGELGLGQIAVDGMFGPDTETAVKAAQQKLGLKPNGVASGALQRKLHDAHTLSPCIDRSQSKVTAAALPVMAADDESGDDATEHTGAMVALVPADDDAERLAVDDGEPVDELHCTLLYLGEAADLDEQARKAITAAVGDVASRYGPVEADGFAISLFNPDSDGREPCIVLGLSGADLAEVHDAVAAEVEASPEQHEPWIPHVTLVYDGDPSMVADLTDRTGPVTFDRIRVAFGDEIHEYPLGSGEPVTAALGHDVTPGHDELHHWWVYGEGRARWKTWTELRDELVEHVGPIKAAIYASAWFHERYGYWSGSDLNRVKHGKPPRGQLVGPG